MSYLYKKYLANLFEGTNKNIEYLRDKLSGSNEEIADAINALLDGKYDEDQIAIDYIINYVEKNPDIIISLPSAIGNKIFDVLFKYYAAFPIGDNSDELGPGQVTFVEKILMNSYLYEDGKLTEDTVHELVYGWADNMDEYANKDPMYGPGGYEYDMWYEQTEAAADAMADALYDASDPKIISKIINKIEVQLINSEFFDGTPVDVFDDGTEDEYWNQMT